MVQGAEAGRRNLHAINAVSNSSFPQLLLAEQGRSESGAAVGLSQGSSAGDSNRRRGTSGWEVDMVPL